MKPDQLIQHIPEQLLQRIHETDAKYKQRSPSGAEPRIAAFDLDNTLLIGDIGDASFIHLKQEEERRGPLTAHGVLIPFTWQEYDEILQRGDKLEAFTQMVKAYSGLPTSLMRDVACTVMKNTDHTISAEGAVVPVPRPNPVMQAVVAYLQYLGYEIYVISASQQLLVEYVAREYFGIPGTHVIGLSNRLETHPRVRGAVLSAELEEPLTVTDGKADAYRRFISPEMPLITGGDSLTDLYLLNLTKKTGLIIWVGKDDSKLEHVKSKTPHPDIIYFLKQQQPPILN